MGVSSSIKKELPPKQKGNKHAALIPESCSDQLYNCIVKIKINGITSTGFFMKIKKYNEMHFLITCFHCIPSNCFENKEITHVEGSVDPIRDVEIINAELILADLEIVESRISKIEKKAETTKDKEAVIELNALRKSKEALSKEIPLRRVEYNEDELKLIQSFNFITQKKIIYVANVNDEDAIAGSNEYTKQLEEYAKNDEAKVIIMCAKLEEELADYTDEERVEFMKSLGLNSSGLDLLIQATYELLGLKTFFTSGTDECRAWTFKKGMKAPECAGIIHTDFQKGFIKAEVTSYEDLDRLGSEKAVQEAGKLRLEGKDYLMQDGDICYFRFNVSK
jgi:GTP-binding protein YchF